MLTVTPIPSLSDNYIWLLQDKDRQGAAIVDPGDAAPVMTVLAREGITPTAILLTHHHGDHTGGVPGLKTHYPDMVVIGPAREGIPSVTRPVGEGESVAIPGTALRFQVLEIPGHTAGHVAFFGHGAVFCGDTVFSVGCGRLFEGTPAQMHASLGRILALPADTNLYCAHEYTLDNIGFAKWVEPENERIKARELEAFAQMDRGAPTVPTPLALELATNPFLRTGVPAVIRAAERYAGRRLADGVAVFAAIRRWKDREYD